MKYHHQELKRKLEKENKGKKKQTTIFDTLNKKALDKTF